MLFQSIISNLSPITRNDSMEGKDYLVVPMVMMVEGVHCGTKGPLYYPATELAKIPNVWNHKPVVVYHPTMNGIGISACEPEVITTHKIGVIMNTKFEEGKLKAEAWLDMDRVAVVDNRIADAIANNQILELSTGLYTEDIETDGEFGGEKYIAIATNLRPDHLAVLPDQIGACSIADGAGFLRLNNANQLVVNVEKMDTTQKEHYKDHGERILNKLSKLLTNELSFDDTRRLLWSKLDEVKPNSDVYIEEVYDGYFIYEEDGGYKKQEYSISTDGKVVFDGLPVDVKKTVNYVQLNRKGIKMNKKELIQALITNATTKWTEEDRKTLEGMEESVLNKMLPEEKKTDEPTDNEEDSQEDKVDNEEKNEPAPTDNKKKKVEKSAPAPTQNKRVTTEEYINAAPPEIQQVLRNGVSTYEAQKNRLIAIIKANENCAFTDNQLKTKDVEELKAIAKLAQNTSKAEAHDPGALFDGQLDPVANTSTEDPLDTPVMNFDNEKKDE